MFDIEMLPAGHGDSLLLAYGDPARPHYVLIDGGPYTAFSSRDKQRLTLQRRIQQLLPDCGRIELLVITHVDADHIEAPVCLLGSLPANLQIGQVWFNDLSHLQNGWLGPEQGEMLSALLQETLHLPWNTSFGGKAVACSATSAPPTTHLEDGLQLTVLSPTPEKMTALVPEWERAWKEAVKEAGAAPANEQERRQLALKLLRESRLRPRQTDGWLGDPVALYGSEPFEEDQTLPNGSSIALLVEYQDAYDGGKAKSCLFAGDAHPSVLAGSLQRLLAARGGAGALEVGAFKLPHHGSKNNLSPELLSLVKTGNYLLSSNGSYYAHPHPQAIARLLKANQAGWDEIVLWFNYRSQQTEIWDDNELRQRYHYRTHYPLQKNQSLVVRL